MSTIRSLPPHLGEAVTLYYIDGLSYEDIGRFLSVPPSTVKGRLQSGRKRLKERMLTMVEDTLHDESPSAEFTEEVLHRIMNQTRQAREDRAHEQILDLCEEALEVLDHLGASEDNTRARIDTLRWRAHEHLHWLGKAQDAAAGYGEAADLAEDLGDPQTQVEHLLCRLTALFCAGQSQDLPELASRAADIYASIGDLQGQTTSRAISDLVEILPLNWQPTHREGGSTGCGVHRFTLRHTIAGIELQQEKRPLRGPIGLGHDMFRHSTLLAQVGEPALLLTPTPDVGQSWQGELRDREHGQLLVATRTIESGTDTVVVPAGRFDGCLRVVTMVAEPPKPDHSDTMKSYHRRVLCGRRTMWFAPGVGLVKYRHEDDWWGHSRVAELATYSVTDPVCTDYLPLSCGSGWQYRWPHDIFDLFVTESYRVVALDGSDVHLACAAYSEPADDADLEVCYGRMVEGAASSGDLREQAWGLACLADARARQGNVPEAVDAFGRLDELLTQIDDPVLTCDLLMRTETDGISPDFLLQRFDRAVAAARQLGDSLREAHVLGTLADLGFRRARYDVALDAGIRRLTIARQHRNAEEICKAEAAIDLGRILQEDPRGEEAILGGTRNGLCITIHDTDVVVAESSGGVAPMVSSRRPVPPIYGSELWSPIPLLKGPVVPGTSWEHSHTDGSWVRSIEAIDDRVDTPAGRFEGCVRVLTKVRLRPATDVTPFATDRYLRRRTYVEGEKRMWLAPGAGVVKAEHDHAEGKRTLIELTSCSLDGDLSGWYPLAVGSWWQYEWRDETGELLFRSRERVVLQEDCRYYLACSGYTTNQAEYAP